MSDPSVAHPPATSKSAAVFLLSLVVAILALWASLSPANAADQGTGFLEKEGVAPPGANDPECRPDREHPNPVVLVPGTFEDMARNWVVLSSILADRGYCVYALNYGFTKGGGFATGRIQDSAKELDVFVNRVLRLTGAKKVSIVGHSQGGMMPRYYIKFLGGDEKVNDLVGLVPSNHGTTVSSGEPTPGANCKACNQQARNSEFLRKLNRGDETPGEIDYTVVTTKFDEIVIPYQSAYLKGPGSQRTNILVQDFYPASVVDHQFMPQDLQSLNFVYDALANEGPANPKRAVRDAQIP